MCVIQLKDAANILNAYFCDSNIQTIKVLEYYDLNNENCLVLLIKTESKKYIIKLISRNIVDLDNEEQQALFSEFLRKNGIPTPRKYKNYNGQYCFIFSNYKKEYCATVEDYFGTDIKIETIDSAIALGTILAKMHNISIKNKYHLKNGPTYNALITGKTEMQNIWGNNDGSMLSKFDYERINAIHQRKIDDLKKIWSQLPKGAVHGDLGFTSNLMMHKNTYGVIDFNLSGDEVFLNDMLVTWYSSRYNYNFLKSTSLERINELHHCFFDSYYKNRDLSKAERESICEMSCIINGIYFNRFVADVIKKCDYIKPLLVSMIKNNYFQEDANCELRNLI